jgi:aquaporin Z
MSQSMVKLLVEFIGTFTFLSVIVGNGQAIPIAVALLAAIYFGGAVSGGHFNPAVTLMKYVEGSMSNSSALGYVGAQAVGAVSALWVYRNLLRPNASA